MQVFDGHPGLHLGHEAVALLAAGLAGSATLDVVKLDVRLFEYDHYGAVLVRCARCLCCVPWTCLAMRYRWRAEAPSVARCSLTTQLRSCVFLT